MPIISSDIFVANGDAYTLTAALKSVYVENGATLMTTGTGGTSSAIQIADAEFFAQVVIGGSLMSGGNGIHHQGDVADITVLSTGVIHAAQYGLYCDGAYDGGVTFTNYGIVESEFVGIETTDNDDQVYNYGTIQTSLVSVVLGEGNDILVNYGRIAGRTYAGPGEDHLTGGQFADGLQGDEGNDTLIGNSGNDTLVGMSGADHMEGGLGNDTYNVHDSLDTIIEEAGEGRDTVESPYAVSLARLDAVENITLTHKYGVDATGNALRNTIHGNTGENDIRGGAGADKLYAGLDYASDTFVFGKGDTGNTLATGDRVFEFDQKNGIYELTWDRIDLRLIDADPVAGDQAFRFVSSFSKPGAGKADAQVKVVDMGSFSRVDLDYNGDNVRDAVFQVTTLDGGHLSAADFLL